MTFSKKKKNSLNARPKVDTVRYGKVHMFKHLKRTYVHTCLHMRLTLKGNSRNW